MALTCPECGFELKPYFLQSPDFHACHVCGQETSALAFPACFRPPETISEAELRRGEDDASCFYHESKKAAQSCSQCGRFLCALCAAQIGGDVLCPDCIVSGEKKHKIERLERARTLYDSIALIVAVAPVFTVWFSILGGPAAIYLSLRYWKRPTSIVRRYAWRKWLALALGALETGGWAWLIVYLVMVRRQSQ
jgi:hypothetical protein